MSEPLSDEQLHSYGELAEDPEIWAEEGDRKMALALLAEVARLKAENNRLRADLAELTRAAELGAAGRSSRG